MVLSEEISSECKKLKSKFIIIKVIFTVVFCMGKMLRSAQSPLIRLITPDGCNRLL